MEHIEICVDCGESTIHKVKLEMVKESKDGVNSNYSREPYRISECTVCGEVTKTRMNNA